MSEGITRCPPALIIAAGLALLAAPASAGTPADAFERFRGLVGTWAGKNASGDAVELRYQLVADGTAVLEHLKVSGAKEHDMVTLFHMDGDELVLTHYCAAGNQPQMVARVITDREVDFGFRSATGLRSEREGHMHRAVFSFEGDDALRADWTWREGGADRFTETIHARRTTSRP